MEMHENLLKKLQGHIEELIQPSHIISHSDTRRQSKLLGGILLILFFIGISICLTYIISNQLSNLNDVEGVGLTIIGAALILVTYLLNKKGYYIISACFLIGFISLLIHLNFLAKLQLEMPAIDIQFYCSLLIIPVILSFILLDKKNVFITFLVNLVTLLVIIFSQRPSEVATSGIIYSLFIFSFLSLLIVFSSYHFENLEQDRKKDLATINKKIIDLNEHLEEKIKERTNEVQRLLWQKDEFINQLGHDLKNPLNPLVNLLPVLEKTTHGKKNKEILKVLIRNANYMKNLITKMIELARLNSPHTKFTFEDINLLLEMDAILENNKFLINENHIEIKNNLPHDVIINVDKIRFTELINNLLNNAIKYSNGTGTIYIDVKQDDSFVTVSIKDTGIGILEEHLPFIFNEFYKVDTNRYDFDSSGLGLSIAKRIVERHNGTIWAESEGLGKGSTFYFTIPRGKLKKEHGSLQEIYNEIDNMEIKKINGWSNRILLDEHYPFNQTK